MVVGSDGVIAERGQIDVALPVASVTKMLSALATLVALEEGIVSLDDAAGPPGATLRHLLAHASGLGPEKKDGPVARPGSRRIYSNAGFEVLAEHVGTAAAMDFGVYLAQAVLMPLGMERSSVRGSPAHGGYASAADLGRLASELLSPKLIDPATLSLASAVAFPGLAGILPGFGRMDPCDWGLGFELRDDKSPHWTGLLCSSSTFGHFGQSGCFVWVDPLASLGLAVVTDRPFGSWAKTAWPELADAVLSARPVP